jgi:hypothetical protein
VKPQAILVSDWLKTGGELRYSIRISSRVNLKESQKAINWVKSNIMKVCFCPQKRMSLYMYRSLS